MKLLDLFEAGPPIDNVRGLGAVGASGNIDYLGLRVMVKPSVFLKLAAPHPDPRSDYIEKYIASGEPIGAPFLSIHIPQEWFSDETTYNNVVEGNLTETAEISGHEGRHRMTAILKHYGDEPVETHLLFSGLRRRHLTDNMIARLNKSIFSQTDKLINGPWFELTANEVVTTEAVKKPRKPLWPELSHLSNSDEKIIHRSLYYVRKMFSGHDPDFLAGVEWLEVLKPYNPADIKIAMSYGDIGTLVEQHKTGILQTFLYALKNDDDDWFFHRIPYYIKALKHAGFNWPELDIILKSLNVKIKENFADGKGPGKPGDSRRHGIPKSATLAQLDSIGRGKGRKAQLARWQANMRRGRKRSTNEAIAPHGSPENEFELMKAGTKPAALVNPHTFIELYKPVADKLGWPYQQMKIAGHEYNNYVVGLPGEEKRVQRLAMLVQDMNANFALGIKPDKEYHIEMGKLLGYSDQDIRDFLKKINLAENVNAATGAALTVFDIDETLFHTHAKILVVKDDKVVKELDNREFNVYKLGPGEHFDFKQFRDAKFFNDTSVPIDKMWQKAKSTLDTVGRRPGSKVIIVTARSDFDNKDTFLDTFRKHGLDIDKIHVHRAGNLELPSGEAKKKIIGQYLATGEFDMVRLFDDAEVNLRSFLSLETEYPDIAFKAYMVLEDGSVTEYKI
jgi:hypothetical protein